MRGWRVLAPSLVLLGVGSAAVSPADDRVGVNVFDARALPPGWERLPVAFYKDFGALGPPLTRAGRPLAYLPILSWQGRLDTPAIRARVAEGLAAGRIPNPGNLSADDFRDLTRLGQLEARLRADRARLPPGSLFLLGVEPGYRPGGDARTPGEIVADGARLRAMLDRLDAGYRLGLGGISTARTDFVRDAYGGVEGLVFLERILDVPRDFAFDAFVVHPYPSDPAAPSAADSLEQVRSFRRVLAARGLRERELIVGEIGTPFAATPADAAARYTEEALTGLLAARDPALGHPGDGDRLVQRIAWFLLAAPTRPVPGITDNPALDLSRSALLAPDGALTPVGEAFLRATSP